MPREWDCWDCCFWAFPGGTVGKEFPCQCRRCKSLDFDPWVGKIPWRREWPPTPEFLPRKFHGQRSSAGYSPWGHKESDVTEHAQTLPRWFYFRVLRDLHIVLHSSRVTLPSHQRCKRVPFGLHPASLTHQLLSASCVHLLRTLSIWLGNSFTPLCKRKEAELREEKRFAEVTPWRSSGLAFTPRSCPL